MEKIPDKVCTSCPQFPCGGDNLCGATDDKLILDKPEELLFQLAMWRGKLFRKNNMLFANETILWKSVQEYLSGEGFEFDEDIIPYEGSNPVH